MSEIVSLTEEAPEGGYSARAVGESIFTEADTLDDLRTQVREAVRCHFDEGNRNATVEAITLLYRGLPKKARREVVDALLADTDLAEDLMDVRRIVATRGEKTCSSAHLRAAVRRRRPCP